MKALTAVLVVGLLMVGSVRAQGPGDIFWDGFETGDLLHWEGFQIPGGGSIEFPPGSLAPGTQVVVQPVATPSLPADIEAIGQAFEITLEPPLILPAILSLPLAQGEDPSDVWIVEVTSNGEVIVYQTEVVSARPSSATNSNEGGLGALLAVSIILDDHDEFVGMVNFPSRVATSSLRPRITTSSILPPRVRVGESVTAHVAWKGQPSQIEFNWRDGSEDTQNVDSTFTETSQSHVYNRASTRVVNIRAVREAPGKLQQVSEIVLPLDLYTGIAGLWFSTFGGITFDEPSEGDVHGTYVPSQNGDITGFLTGSPARNLTGIWVETISNETCTTQMPDSTGTPSFHWGRLEFVFDEEFTQFCGHWDYCNETPATRIWDGYAPGFSSPDDCP